MSECDMLQLQLAGAVANSTAMRIGRSDVANRVANPENDARRRRVNAGNRNVAALAQLHSLKD
jgi:hypothetical protein